MIVLHECRVHAGGLEFRLVPGLHEKPALIADDMWLNQHYAGNWSFVKPHGR